MSFRNYYDTSYSKRGEPVRPTSVTAKYSNITPAYKTSSIPVLNNDRASTASPIAAIANRYASYKNDSSNKYDKKDLEKSSVASKYNKPISKFEKKEFIDKPTSKYENKDYSDQSASKYDKKDFSSKLTVPSLNTSRSRDVSPISSSSSKYNLSRSSRHLSPGRTTKTYKDKSREPSPADQKDIPNKTDKSAGYNSLSSYKVYPRPSTYTRPSSRAETKPEITVNRYSIASRLSSNYLRSPPTIGRTSVSPVNHAESNKNTKSDNEKSVSPVAPPSSPMVLEATERKENGIQIIIEENGNETETITVITRHTSPTPPGSSAYVRSRRAELAKTIEKTLTRSKIRPEMEDKEIQSDRMDDPTRASRFGSTARASMASWSVYTPTSTSYTGYAGRYSTQYTPSLREPSSHSYNSDRSSRSHSTERVSKESPVSNSQMESSKELGKIVTPLNEEQESKQELVAKCDESKDDGTSEIIINVNFKLKKTNNKTVTASTELVSPEITITNSQLPPQAPKTEGTVKVKKLKTRKSSTDSSSDSGSKKKVVKRKSKSGSSTDSDAASDVNDKGKDSSSPPKGLSKSSSSSNLRNGHAKSKHTKSRESNSPESSTTFSTQSSISEDDSGSKSKTNDGRTSADETSIPTDRSAKQSSPGGSQKEGTDDAKSFLIRALAPVTNLFKSRHQDSSENRSWPEHSITDSTSKDVSNLVTESDKSSKSKNNTSNIIASNDDNLVQLKAIRLIESGERPWWLDSSSDKTNNIQSSDVKLPSDQNTPWKIRHIESGERAWWLESNSESKNEHHTPQTSTSDSTDPSKPLKKFKCVGNDDEKPWWLDSSANVPEGVECLTPPRKSSSESEKNDKFNFFKVRHIDSGEKKDWWLTSNENSSNSKSETQNTLSYSGSEQRFPLRKIRHIDSGEKPWWLSSNQNIPEGIEKLPTPTPLQQQDSDSSDSEEVQVYAPSSQIPPFPLHLPDEPLGARRSPEGLETPKETEDYRGRSSPYENSRHYDRLRDSNLYQKGVKKYISRYTDIDDILGSGGQIYSPFMDSILARRTGQVPDDDECEEIDPTQVRIHDSTAQMPVIKKLRGRGEVIDYCGGEDQGQKNRQRTRRKANVVAYNNYD